MAITLTEPVNYIVHQRDVSLGTADVTIAGTYTSSLGTAEAKITNFVGGATVVDWTEIDASPAANAFSGTLTIPEGGWYLVQVRDGQNTGDTDVGSNKMGVGIVVACAGQSNMRRMFQFATTEVVNDLVSLYNVSAWQHYPALQGAGAISIGNTIAVNTGLPVGLVEGAVGGTGLVSGADIGNGYWLDTSASSIYDDFKVKVNAAAPNGVECVFWIQGETDANVGTSHVDYQAGLGTLITNIRADIANMSSFPDLPFIAAEIGSDTTVGTDDDESTAIRTAIVEAMAENSDAYLGANTIDAPLTDTVHYTEAGQVAVAERLGLSYLKVLELVSYSGLGPVMTSYITNSSTQTDILMVHNGGTAFTPTSAITGFEVLDDGVDAAISAAVLLQNHIIRLTHAAVSGVKTVRYQYESAPTLTGVVVDNTSEALPLRSAGGGISEKATGGSSGATSQRAVRNRMRKGR